MVISVTMTRISLLFLSILFTFSYHSQADLIGDTCKKNDFPDLCISTLRSNPGSMTADVKGLARIAFNATLVKATANLKHVNELLKKESDPILKSCLLTCAEQYADALHDIPMGVQYVGSNNFEAASIAAAVTDEARSCEEAFTENNRSIMHCILCL
ncbi:hypothetical protein Vadar_022570 [Vaccinium darrowii]|uniref:Uncharacterized protein n=1 Tax=Vaccinium darrowii TaxID=229202 RepID=A0ACB7XTQ4_9ERIC|nr:hypothetical protein Vadar_022570 [Vaccinium darrowii]